ncbi:MAG: hypothetical protein ACRD2I_08255 [Vicinamibacterales bacterium]
MAIMLRTNGLFTLALLGALTLGSSPANAQTAPPIHGVTGTVATDSTIKSEHEAAHAVAEGVGKVVDGAKKILPGGKGTKENPLDGFIEGRRVVVQERAEGDSAEAKTTEAVVVDVNRRRSQITVRFADRKTQTLRLADRRAADDGSAPVSVSYTDPTGARIAHDFKLVF